MGILEVSQQLASSGAPLNAALEKTYDIHCAFAQHQGVHAGVQP